MCPALLAGARDWERHVVEVETGLPPDADPGTAPRPEYDPAARTVAQRTQAKAWNHGSPSGGWDGGLSRRPSARITGAPAIRLGPARYVTG
jgi:hypothetical protein